MRKRAILPWLIISGMLAGAGQPPQADPADSWKSLQQGDHDATTAAPFRATYGLSSVAFEVTAPATTIRNFYVTFMGGTKLPSKMLPEHWSDRTARRLPVELAAAASRAGIATVGWNEVPECPPDGRATVGRVYIEVLDVQTQQYKDTGPGYEDKVTNIRIRTGLRLTDNCDRELKRDVYAPQIASLRSLPVEEFLEGWPTSETGPPTMHARARVLADNPGLFAEAIVTSGLLAWMPAWPARESLKKRSTPFTLRAVSPEYRLAVLFSTENDREPVMDSSMMLRWESLPELLVALGPADLLSRISDVRYELVVYHEDRPVTGEWDKVTTPLFHFSDLAGAQWDGSDALEPCESYAWSARAHFRLDGFPRTTAWSGPHYGPGVSRWPELVWPNGQLHWFRTPPPKGFDRCH